LGRSAGTLVIMREKLFIPTVCALLLLMSGAVLAQQQGSSDPSLWIVVRDEMGAPLKDACITVVPGEGEILFRKADSKGRVRIKKLARGRYRVTAKVDGYEAQKKEVTVGGATAAEASAETVSFSLQPRHE
jgi:hypothetical protein